MARSGGRARRVTLAEVAHHAGVSATTASFVLSGRTDMRISTATTDRVLQSARELNYVLPHGTRFGAPRRMPALAFVSDTIATEPFAGEMVRGAVAAASKRGHSLIVAETQGSAGLESEAVRDLLARGVDRFIFATTKTRELPAMASLDPAHAVLTNCFDAGNKFSAILPADRRAGQRAAQTLLTAGHSDRIWLVGEIGGPSTAGQDRHHGVTDGLKAANLRLERHIRCSWWPPDTCEVVSEALHRHRPPTAVIALNDRVAMGVYQAAAECGLSIPADLSVVAFDNSDLAWWLAPGLTSLGLPYYDMGRRAVELLLGDGADVRRELLTMPLHERGSVGPPTTVSARPTLSVLPTQERTSTR